MLSTLHSPDYSMKLNTIEDFVTMSYGPLPSDKVRRLKDIFDYFEITIYLETQMANFKKQRIDTEDTFLGIWKFLHENFPKLIKEINDELKL